MQMLIKCWDRIRSIFLPEPIKETWFEDKQRRLQQISFRSMNRYNSQIHGDLEIDVHYDNVEKLLIAIDVLISALDSKKPLTDNFFLGEHKQSITVDNWLVTTDGYTASLLNIHTAIMPRFASYVKALNNEMDDAKKSYYMRVSLKVHRDIETLVDLLTHHWET